MLNGLTFLGSRTEFEMNKYGSVSTVIQRVNITPGCEAKQAFVERLGIRARGRAIAERQGAYGLREPRSPYKDDITTENVILRLQNT